MPNQKLSQFFPPKSVSNKSSAIHVGTKPNKTVFHSSNYYNRKNLKNWKTKSTTSRISKIPDGMKISPTISSKNSKTTQKFWHLSKTKDVNIGKGFFRTTLSPLKTHGLPLTIVLRPSGDFTSHQKVPDVFQKYPKVQQLFPLYVNSGRVYNEENLPRYEFTSSYLAKSNSKSKSRVNVQKTERQNRFDTSLSRTGSEGKAYGNKKQSSNRKQHIQGKKVCLCDEVWLLPDVVFLLPRKHSHGTIGF